MGELIFVFGVAEGDLGLLGGFEVAPEGVTVYVVNGDDVFVVGGEFFDGFDHFLTTGTFFGVVEDAGEGIDGAGTELLDFLEGVDGFNELSVFEELGGGGRDEEEEN